MLYRCRDDSTSYCCRPSLKGPQTHPLVTCLQFSILCVVKRKEKLLARTALSRESPESGQ